MPFTSAEFERVAEAYERVAFSKGAMLLQEGQCANDYALLERGMLRAFAVDPEGQDRTTGFFLPGQIVIEVASFFMRRPTRENIQAMDDGVCWRISFDRFQTLFHSIEAYREWGRGCLVEQFFALKQRSLSMITDSATERYQQLLATQPEIVQQAALKHVASYLGITDTSLSRIRKAVATP
ncbi:MAG: Crp/Fnr family transcriptional regulator [Bacteroidota bacterium]